MTTENDLIGLPTRAEVAPSLEKLKARVETLGVEVVDDLSNADHARFVGIFENRTIILYPNVAPAFALWFTVAHLFGHLSQLTNKTTRVNRANELVLRINQTLTVEEIQLIYDHEREAAEIGRALIADVEPNLDAEMDADYTRFFHADFRYLINFIETGEQGVEMFARFWRREPTPRELIAPDPRELLDLSKFTNLNDKIIVV